LGAVKLPGKAASPVPFHRSPDFSQGIPRDAFDLTDLLDRAGWITIGQLRGELRLQRYDRERMAKKIVQIPGNALPLGNLRHLLDTPLRALEQCTLANSFTDEEVPAAGDDDDAADPGCEDKA